MDGAMSHRHDRVVQLLLPKVLRAARTLLSSPNSKHTVSIGYGYFIFFGLGGGTPQTPWILAGGAVPPADLPPNRFGSPQDPPPFFFPSTGVFAGRSSTESEKENFLKKNVGEFLYP